MIKRYVAFLAVVWFAGLHFTTYSGEGGVVW